MQNANDTALPVSGQSGRLTLLHFGDLHLWRLGWDADFAVKRLLGLTNLIVRRGRRFPEPVARQLVARLTGEQADALLFSGDLTTTSLRGEFRAAQELLKPLLDRWGRRFIAIPGNHDRYTRRAAQSQLFETLFTQCPRELPFAVDLNERWTLAGFDCSAARSFTSRGHLAPAGLARLDELLREQRRRGRQLIAMGHYPLAYPGWVNPRWQHVLPERAAVLETLRLHDARLYLHGHVHSRWRLEADGLTHLNCGSAGMIGRPVHRRPGYLKIILNDNGVEAVEAHWLELNPDNAPDTPNWISRPLRPNERMA